MWKRRGIRHVASSAEHLLDGKTFRVDMQPAVRLAWFGLILFCSFGVLCLFTGQLALSPIFLVFAALSVLLRLVSGSVEMSLSKITLRIPTGRYEMLWNEISKIETDRQRGSLVFYGPNKKLAITGPGWWSGEHKEQMIALLDSEIKKRSIPVKQTQKALFMLSRNCKGN
jgi:hypothetical protein